jgi:23S rRNA (uracil1939-C5)-methyltransferase
MNNTMATITLSVEKMVFGGMGLARTSQGIMFISGVMPGETVVARISGEKTGGIPIARLVSITKASLHRIEPVCPLFTICGGCDWQYMDYGQQLEIKKSVFLETLKRIGRLTDIPDPQIVSGPMYGYRRRVQLKCDALNKSIGFYKKQSHDVVDVSTCPLLCKGLNGFIEAMAEYKTRIPVFPEQIKAIAGNKGELYVPEDMASSPAYAGISCSSTSISCSHFLFPVSGESFFQGNCFCAPLLGDLATQWLSGDTFLDLYGGSGFFSCFVARKFGKGILIDAQESHISLANKTFEKNNITNVAAQKNTVFNFCKYGHDKKQSIDCCIVDPPRTGFEKGTAKALGILGPKTIFYVSCDPSTCARDVSLLVHEQGYTCVKTALLDFYPQTHHMESVVLLEKKAVSG